jgi:hypothetical protein
MLDRGRDSGVRKKTRAGFGGKIPSEVAWRYCSTESDAQELVDIISII